MKARLMYDTPSFIAYAKAFFLKPAL